jgi:hypothetical protein
MNPLRSISKSVPCTLLAAILLANPAQAQLSGGSQSQLRPPSGAKITPQGGLVPPAKTTPQVAQANARVARKALHVDLPVTDFGKTDFKQPLNQYVTVRMLYEGDGAKGIKSLDLPEIRIGGAQAAAFVAAQPQCSNKVDIDKLVEWYSCIIKVTFHPTTDGPHAAFLVANFPDGDQFTGQLKGFGQGPTVAMPAPAGIASTGLAAQVGNKPLVGVAMVSETVDFGSVNRGARKTLRVATQYPAGTRVLPHFGGAKISNKRGGVDQFTLGETALSMNGAASGEKASFTITFTPGEWCMQEAESFTFRDLDGRQRRLELKGICPN